MPYARYGTGKPRKGATGSSLAMKLDVEDSPQAKNLFSVEKTIPAMIVPAVTQAKKNGAKLDICCK